jgi:hypothetical protein
MLAGASSKFTEQIQVTKTNDRPDLSPEGAPDIDKTENVTL